MALSRRNAFASDEVKEEEKGKEEVKATEKLFKKESIDIFVMREFYLIKQDGGMLDRIDKLVAAYKKDLRDSQWTDGKKVKIKNLGKDYTCGRWSAKKDEIVEIPDFEAKRLLQDFPQNWKVVE